jgi:hypothetical protein
MPGVSFKRNKHSISNGKYVELLDEDDEEEVDIDE